MYIYVHTYPHHPQETSQSQKEAIFILKVPITVFQDNSQKLYSLCHLSWSILATKDTDVDKAKMMTDSEISSAQWKESWSYKSLL